MSNNEDLSWTCHRKGTVLSSRSPASPVAYTIPQPTRDPHSPSIRYRRSLLARRQSKSPTIFHLCYPREIDNQAKVRSPPPTLPYRTLSTSNYIPHYRKIPTQQLSAHLNTPNTLRLRGDRIRSCHYYILPTNLYSNALVDYLSCRRIFSFSMTDACMKGMQYAYIKFA